jgi:VWFA-related protein
VSVDVSVRSGGKPVGGLGAKDFVLLDNGVGQQIEVVDTEAVPLDVSLIIDTSGSTITLVGQLTNDMRRIAAILRPDDRLRLLTIDTYVNEIFPMQPAATRPAIDRLTANGLSSVHDALAASMLRPVEPNRRHIIIALTDGIDSISALRARTVRDIAERSDATLHIGHVDISAARYLAAFQCAMMGWCSPTRRFWLPFQDHDPETLREAARLTGGDLHEPGVFVDANPVGIFKQVFDDFRRSYVLRYMPKGVAREGWHDLTVRVPAAPSFVVRARKGYAIGSNGPAVGGRTSAPVWAASARALPPAIEPVVSAYDRGDYAAAATALRKLPEPVQFIRDFRAIGNPWPANPRREAALVIEIAEAALYRHDVPARAEALALLQGYHQLIRNPLGADEFECLWHWAELTAVEGLIRPGLAMPFVTNALKRCPEEPRFKLAQAMVSDQLSPLGAPNPEQAEKTLQLYDTALQSERTASEARLRKAYLLHRLGRRAEGLALLDTMRARESDQTLVYLGQLLRGRVHDALDHVDEAANAYRAALQTWPDAQAPRVGLMTLLFRHGDRPGAERMAEAIQSAVAQAFDPWWQYWQGDYRFYPAAIAALREGSR